MMIGLIPVIVGIIRGTAFVLMRKTTAKHVFLIEILDCINAILSASLTDVQVLESDFSPSWVFDIGDNISRTS